MTKHVKICGCCGAYTEPQEQDYNQDTGYGHCQSCRTDIDAKNEAEWQKSEKLVADSLNPTNREKFLAMELPLRRGIILKMIEDGIITYSVTSRG